MLHQQSVCVFLMGLFVFLLTHRPSLVECRKIPSMGSLQFFAIGDWGGQIISPYYTKVEKAVAEELGNLAEHLKPEFILALGMVNIVIYCQDY